MARTAVRSSDSNANTAREFESWATSKGSGELGDERNFLQVERRARDFESSMMSENFCRLSDERGILRVGQQARNIRNWTTSFCRLSNK